jgi:hypothetical protein
MNGKWRLAGKGRSKPQRIATGRIELWRTRPWVSAQPMKGVAMPRVRGRGTGDVLCSLTRPLGLFCILPYFALFVYYLVSKERLYEASILRVIELSPTQLMSDLGFCNATPCKTNAVRSKKRRRFGVIMCYGDRVRPLPQFSK